MSPPRWMTSLGRLAELEVETLQRRLRDIGERRAVVDLVLASLDHEEREERAHADRDAAFGWYLSGFRDGLKARRARAQGDLEGLRLEERGARDALAQAFEAQKKYETLADNTRLAAARKLSRADAAALDELALRRAAAP